MRATVSARVPKCDLRYLDIFVDVFIWYLFGCDVPISVFYLKWTRYNTRELVYAFLWVWSSIYMTLVYEEKTKKIVNVLMIFITIIEFSLPILIFVYQQVKQSKLYIKKYFTICTISSLIIKFFYKQQHKIKTYFKLIS